MGVSLHEVKMAVLWSLWVAAAIFVFVGIFKVPDILNLFSVAGCFLHYLLKYEKTGL